MPDLIVMIGPLASGKAAVGSALSKLTGFRFLHNHQLAEASAAIFDWSTPPYREALADMCLLLFSKALAQPLLPNLIFTWVWKFNVDTDNKLMADLVLLFESKGQHVFFVELVASPEERIKREGTSLRLELKPIKQDVERARALHTEWNAKYLMNSEGAFPFPERHLIINTEQQSREESALMICRHFGFVFSSKRSF